MTPRLLTLLAASASATLAASASAAPAVTVAHDEAAKKVSIRLDGQLFTEFVYNSYSKPILHPILGPGGVPMTRDWPMKDGTPNEDKDHIHHRSLWFTHGSVNGIDFWSEDGKNPHGKVVTVGKVESGIEKTAADGEAAFVLAKNQWTGPDGKALLNDTTRVRAGTTPSGARFIDWSTTLTAADKPVVLGDTKEGTMAIRTRPELQLNPEKNKTAAGKAVNSEGLTGKAIWGKPARWVDYVAPIQGKTLGIAIFDSPANPRHPTTWHAREYGLIAANPFGLHDFSGGKLPKDAGNITLEPGKELTFSYRFILHEGDTAAAGIDGLWKTWSGRK